MKYDIKEYLDLIGKGKLLEAEILRAGVTPKRLIKFVWLDSSESDEKKFTSLLEEKLWLSATKYLNDPFEFKGLFLNRKALKDAGYTDEIIDKYEKLFDLTEYGVVCLSERPVDYLPMWAYYTNNYKGFCIEYEVLNGYCLHEVSYEEKRIPIASLIFQIKEELDKAAKKGEFGSPRSAQLATLFKQNLYMKSCTWEHEKEYRIVQPIKNAVGENYRISDLGLKTERIIAGMNCDPDNIERLNQISKQLGCGSVLVSRLSDEDYSLQIEEYESKL